MSRFPAGFPDEKDLNEINQRINFFRQGIDPVDGQIARLLT
jgi:hypothetical protein